MLAQRREGYFDIWYVYLGCWAVLELDSHPDHEKGPDPHTLYKFLRHIPFKDPNNTTLQATNPLIERPLPGRHIRA